LAQPHSFSDPSSIKGLSTRSWIRVERTTAAPLDISLTGWGRMALLVLVTRQFHIEDRARGRVVAVGEIDASGLVVWDETEASVSEELPDLAEQIQQDVAAGYNGGQLRHPLEWFEL